MSENEKRLRRLFDELAATGPAGRGGAVVMRNALDALLAEHRAEVERLTAQAESKQEEIERQMAERQSEWQGKQNEAGAYERTIAGLRGALSSARDAALEEAAQAIDRRRMSGGGVIEQEGLDELANAACITRALQSAPAAVVPVAKVREVVEDVRGRCADDATEAVALEIARRLVEVHAEAGGEATCRICARPRHEGSCYGGNDDGHRRDGEGCLTDCPGCANPSDGDTQDEVKP